MCVEHERIGRYTFIPEYHARHGEKYTLAERAYLARYFDIDGPKYMSLSLERPINIIYSQVKHMKKNGEWDLYRSLTDDEYEKIIMAGEWSNEKAL